MLKANCIIMDVQTSIGYFFRIEGLNEIIHLTFEQFF